MPEDERHRRPDGTVAVRAVPAPLRPRTGRGRRGRTCAYLKAAAACVHMYMTSERRRRIVPRAFFKECFVQNDTAL